MDKPKAFINWESNNYYTWGYLNIGRVSIPVFVLSMLYLAVFVLSLVLAIFLEPFRFIAVGMLAFVASAGVIFGISAFLYWVWDSIVINGPEDS